MIPTQNGWSDAAEEEREAQHDFDETPHSLTVFRVLAELRYKRQFFPDSLGIDKSTTGS